MTVDINNIEEFIKEVLDALVGRGVQSQAQSFREGFSKVFPVTDLQSFSSDELAMMFGNAEEDWSSESKCRSKGRKSSRLTLAPSAVGIDQGRPRFQH